MVEEMALIHHITFKEQKNTPSLHFGVTDGSFGLDVEPYRFETCRERFGRHWDHTTKGFYLTHPVNAGYSVATFLKKTEIILKQTQFSEYALTNRDTILWIEPSQFWMCCRMRRSLLTILVRAGMVYDPKKDNYEEALFSEKWAKPTRIAVMRFLFGFTKYVGPDIENQPQIESRGWRYVFDNPDEQHAKKCLIWPDEFPYKPKGPVSGIWI
jgi:hypothetical protein